MFNVLVAEDELWIRKAIIEVVETTDGFNVIAEAKDGQEAWDLIQETWPTLLITDIMMPNKDGLWLIENIAARKLPMEAIIISGYDNFQYAQSAMRHNVSEYLLKPIKEAELKQALERLIKRLQSNQQWHKFLLNIQNFVDELPDCDLPSILSRMEQLLQSVFDLNSTFPAYSTALLRMLADRWIEFLHCENPTYTAYKIEFTQDEVEIREFFNRLLEDWKQACLNNTKQPDKKVITEICRLVQQNYRKTYTLAEMAEKAHMSVSQFCSQFKRQTGKTFIHYINTIRIEKAKELLLEPDLNVYDAADLVGYATLSYFNRVFKEIEGISPKEFRKIRGI